MTPDDLIDKLQKLVRAQRFRDAVELTVRVLPDIRSQMTPDHAIRLHEIMHFADTAADLEASASAMEQVEPEPQTTRRA